MATKRIFVFSLMTMLITLLALYININRPIPNVNMNMNLTLSDDVWMGMALFINYLLIVCFYGQKPSILTNYSPKSSNNF